jgi:hypothetical protein
MTTDLTSSITPDFHSILSQTAIAYREGSKPPKADVVVNALLQAEKYAKQQRLNYPFDSLMGKWRLCFVTGTKKIRKRGGIVLGNGFYVPRFASAHISFSITTEQVLDRGEIGNQVQLGSILLNLTGPAKYLGNKNLLAFDFTQMQISFSDRVVYNRQIRSGKTQTLDFDNQPIAKLPFFAFFLLTEDFIAARGRGGGLAIWIKANPN